MKHGRHLRKLGKDASHRWAMIRTMVTQLIEHERIQTTVAKAKELRRVADRVVTFAKEGSLRARRKAAAVVRTDAAVNKLFTELAERYKERPGGFTRVLQIGQRKSDSAAMAYIEYVDRDGELRPARETGTIRGQDFKRVMDVYKEKGGKPSKVRHPSLSWLF